jgi:transposase
LLVDTLGLVLKVQVQAANIQDRQGAYRFLAPLGELFPQVQIVWADKGYTGELGEWMQSHLGWQLQIMQRSVSKPEAEARS